MRDFPMLFSGPMVRAILDGCKTQTRRIMKRQPQNVVVPGIGPMIAIPKAKGSDRWLWPNARDEVLAECPYGNVGDRLWVRETWMPGYDHDADHEDGPRVSVIYRADAAEESVTAPSYELAEQWDRDYSEDGDEPPPWRPSIHMPRWACRLMLEITAVRIERLQDISEADAIAEGIEQHSKASSLWKRGPLRGDQNIADCTGFPRLAFRSIWEAINGADSWAENPGVWVVEFRRLEVSNG